MTPHPPPRPFSAGISDRLSTTLCLHASSRDPYWHPRTRLGHTTCAFHRRVIMCYRSPRHTPHRAPPSHCPATAHTASDTTPRLSCPHATHSTHRSWYPRTQYPRLWCRHPGLHAPRDRRRTRQPRAAPPRPSLRRLAIWTRVRHSSRALETQQRRHAVARMHVSARLASVLAHAQRQRPLRLASTARNVERKGSCRPGRATRRTQALSGAIQLSTTGDSRSMHGHRVVACLPVRWVTVVTRLPKLLGGASVDAG